MVIVVGALESLGTVVILDIFVMMRPLIRT